MKAVSVLSLRGQRIIVVGLVAGEGFMESVEKPPIKTFGFYPIVVIPLSFYLFLLFVAISVQHFGGIIFFGLSSFLFLTGSIARIKILRDGGCHRKAVVWKVLLEFLGS